MKPNDLRLRAARAQAWACGQSFGPWGQGIDEAECRSIEHRRDEILAGQSGPSTDHHTPRGGHIRLITR